MGERKTPETLNQWDDPWDDPPSTGLDHETKIPDLNEAPEMGVPPVIVHFLEDSPSMGAFHKFV